MRVRRRETAGRGGLIIITRQILISLTHPQDANTNKHEGNTDLQSPQLRQEGAGRGEGIQGNLAHKKTPTPLEPP